MNEIGITSYGVAIPRRRLDVNEIADLWMNLEKGVVTNKWGMKERTVLAQDEDSTTLAVAAAKEAFLRNEKAKEVEALYYGTCTNPYDSRPSGTIVLEALDLPYSTKCTDVQFSTKSGTAALLESYAMVKAGLAKQALAIGTDTIDRHTAPGDLLESCAGAGAGAVVLGTEDVVATIDGIESYSTDISDGFRVEGERYIRTGLLIRQDKYDVGILPHTKAAAEALMKKLGTKPEDYKYVVLQQNTPAITKMDAAALGFTEEQLAPSMYCEMTGDTGASSPLIGLAKVLEEAKAGDKIFLVSYGFGAGSDAVSLTVTENIEKIRGKGKTVDEHISNKTMLDYKMAMKLEYKYIRPSYSLTAYL